MHCADSCFVPGITFQGMRTPSWDSSSRNSVMMMITYHNDQSVCFFGSSLCIGLSGELDDDDDDHQFTIVFFVLLFFYTKKCISD